MLLTELAETSAAVAATASRTQKRALLAQTLSRAPIDEVSLVVTYLSGTLRQRRTGIGWASLRSVPQPVTVPSLTVPAVDGAFEEISGIAGPGSATTRAAAVAEILGRATESEQRFLRALIFEDIRQGALDALVQDALAEAFGVAPQSMHRGAMLLGSTAAAADVLARNGTAALSAVRLRVGQPVRPMLAATDVDVDGAVTRSGLPAMVDAKLDGIRVQVHRDGDVIGVYSRSLDDITGRVPEIVDAVRALPVTQIVLDGEAIAVGADGRALPFQVTASRTASSIDVVGGQRQTPLSLFCFDLIHLNGIDLLDAPLEHRVATLSEVVPAGMLVPRREAHTADEVAQFFDDAVRGGFEGVVVKNLQAPYAAGRRDSGWVKLKPRHTFDLAVTAAEWGHGRRHGKLSNLHLAAREPQTGEWVMLGKTFKGLTDEMLGWQTAQMLAREVRRTASTVFIDPPLVAEIACDGLQTSSRYPGGVALRFARVVRYRQDKAAGEVDTMDTVLALLAGRSAASS